MSSGESDKKTVAKPRKKRKTKRCASSPLNDTGCPGKSEGVSSINGQRAGYNKKNVVNGAFINDLNQPHVTSYSNSNSTNNCGSTGYFQNMSYPQPTFGGFSFGNQGSFPTSAGSPTMTSMPPPLMSTQPPDWATQLINDVRTIKTQVSKIEEVQQTVNQICVRIKDLETNVTSIDTRLSTVENSCSFIGNKYDDHKKELDEAKSKLKNLQSTCDKLEKKTQTLETEKTALQSKLTDLEWRDMRPNLMFYGVPEQENEDCEQTVKQIMVEQLGLLQAGNVMFERVHRVGLPARGKVRPIVARFTYYKEREMVRSKSFEHADNLKKANLGIGTQSPKEIREARKTLYTIMEQEKAKGNAVKMVRDRLYINGNLYKPDEPMATETSS